MNITLTKNTHLLAALNQHVHDVHVEAYSNYFKPYHYDLVKAEFDTIIALSLRIHFKIDFLFLALIIQFGSLLAKL